MIRFELDADDAASVALRCALVGGLAGSTRLGFARAGV